MFLRHFIRGILTWVFCVFYVSTSPPVLAQNIGWRNDGTGVFENVVPPTVWSAHDNVLWKTDMSGVSNSSPIVVGNLVFTTAEPTDLIAVDAGSGKIIWKATHDVRSILTTSERVVADKLVGEGERAEQALSVNQRERNRVKRDLRKNLANDQELRERQRILDAEVVALEKKIAEAAPYRIIQDKDIIGYASPTPVSDGTNVFAIFGNGVIAAYTMDGKRLWVRWLGAPYKPMFGYRNGSASSPVLVDGVLVVGYRELNGLDPKTGKTLWKGKEYRHFGTPLVVKHKKKSYVITPDGQLIRPKDGKTLKEDLGFLWYVAPVWRDGTLFFVGNSSDWNKKVDLLGYVPDNPSAHHVFNGLSTSGSGLHELKTQGRAVSVFSAGSRRPQNKERWERSLEGAFRRRIVRRDFYHGSAVYYEGQLYIVSSTGYLSALDAKTGEIVFDKRLRTRMGTVTATPTVAAGYIYVVADNGQTVVFRAGKEFDLVSTNSLGPQRATPFFKGSRVYMRTFDALYCIGK